MLTYLPGTRFHLDVPRERKVKKITTQYYIIALSAPENNQRAAQETERPSVGPKSQKPERCQRNSADLADMDMDSRKDAEQPPERSDEKEQANSGCNVGTYLLQEPAMLTGDPGYIDEGHGGRRVDRGDWSRTVTRKEGPSTGGQYHYAKITS
ncbi:hypothetical protein Bbelb_032590 [Branchiostoma belcheri]|nr:hypothetical protein Bbelb_032590 [Branchiostoma belcheri]